MSERDWSFFSEICLGYDEGFREFGKFTEVSGGGQVMVGKGRQWEADFREIILKKKRN